MSSDPALVKFEVLLVKLLEWFRLRRCKGGVLCTFLPLVGDPYNEVLYPDKNGFARRENGEYLLIIPGKPPVYWESLPQEVNRRDVK